MPVLLHIHIAAGFDSSAENTLGLNADPLWEPSHQGWLDDLPHAHHAYVFPDSSSVIFGDVSAASGNSIVFLNFIKDNKIPVNIRIVPSDYLLHRSR